MTVDALEYLRTEDPAPDGSSAPPLGWVLARIEREAIRPAPRRRRRRAHLALIPTIAVAATVAVVAAVVVLAVAHRAQAPSHTPPATHTAPTLRPPPSPDSLMPRGGMHGTLFIQGAVSAAGGRVFISFSQCQPCHEHGRSPIQLWQATTTDSGSSWQVARAAVNLTQFAFGGRDGWAEGLDAHHVARFFVTHDAGQTWRVASSAASAPGGVGDVAVAGGEVWSVGSRCSGTTCTDPILHAPTSSDHLALAAGQPPLGDSTNISIVAAGRDDALVLTSDYGANPKVAAIAGTRLFATHDGGRTWRRMAAPCPARNFGQLYGSATNGLWALCSGTHGPASLRRSADGGAHWTRLAFRPGNDELHPASAQVVWATTPAGEVVRTADAGRTWTRVWYGGRPEASAPTNFPPGLNRRWNLFLTVQSTTRATVIVQVTRGHGRSGRTDFVTYRTTDGGRTWRPGVVRLPAG